MIIRSAVPSDIEHIREIYKHYVLKTSFTFDYECPSLEDFHHKHSSSHCFLVAEQEQQILGYAYASVHRAKRAYRWATEVTIYLDPNSTGIGVGKRLYSALFDIIKHLNYKIILAGVTRPNPASEGFHESMGFSKIYSHENIGFKFGAWHSVDWYRKAIGSFDKKPAEIVDIESLDESLIQSIFDQYSD